MLDLPPLPTITPYVPTPAPTFIAGTNYRVVNPPAGGATMHSEPNPEAPVIVRIPAGRTVLEIGAEFEAERRYRNVRDAGGREGWVLADWLEVAEGPGTPTRTPVPETPTATASATRTPGTATASATATRTRTPSASATATRGR